MILPALGNATIWGVERATAFTIYNDGSFDYTNSILVYNDLDWADTYNANWLVYTSDLGSVVTSGLTFTGDYVAWAGDDPWQPGIWREGYQRAFEVLVNPNSYHWYTWSYSGPAGFWNFGDHNGVYYGDGHGGADTEFDEFRFHLTLPDAATDYNILYESCSGNLAGADPFVFNWFDQGVWGIDAHVEFSGPELNPYPGTIPEPTSLALLGLGLAGMGLVKRFRK